MAPTKADLRQQIDDLGGTQPPQSATRAELVEAVNVLRGPVTGPRSATEHPSRPPGTTGGRLVGRRRTITKGT